MTRRLLPALAAALLVTPDLAAQHLPADSTRPRRGAEVAIPLASFVLPGFGQYVYGAHGTGAAYSALFLAGAALGSSRDVPDSLDLPRDPRDQLSDLGWSFAMSADWLSAWDAFQRGLPAQRAAGKYAFMTRRETVGDLITAPFDARFLRRWTTWVDLAQTAAITSIILSERERGSAYNPFRGHDAGYAATASINAAVGEEAFFRGYLMPMLYQKTGRFWVANGAQAAVFGAAHMPAADWYAAVIGGWALWEGWVTRRNDWSVRESIFHHFWYDVAVISAAMLVDEKPSGGLRLGFRNVPF